MYIMISIFLDIHVQSQKTRLKTHKPKFWSLTMDGEI